MGGAGCLPIFIYISVLGTIQGSDAVLAFFKNDWIPFVCSTDVSISISATKAAVRTRGDGHWKKFTYQDCTFTVTLSGILKFDGANFTGWDMLDNVFNFNHILMRCSFDDQNGDVQTVEGYVMVETGTLGFSQGALVKNDFSLQGHGKLDVFQGLVPCPTVITSITVDGQEAMDGTVHVSYTYTGEAYQIKYRIDGTGDYIYALADLTLDIPRLTVDAHSIEIIPVCLNGYEGTGMDQSFVVTQAMTCTSACTGLVIHTDNGAKYSALGSGVTVAVDAVSDYILPTITGTATSYQYSWDGSSTYNAVPIGTQIPLAGLSAGPHTLVVVPVCTFSGGRRVQGTGFTGTFTLGSQPSQSIINYSYANFPPGNTFNVYVDGVLTVSLSVSNGSGSITASIGAIIKTVLQTTQPPFARSASLQISDDTTSTPLYNNTQSSPILMQYSFTANGDEFTINALVSA